jgi:SAM-dependent methyltransferase
MNVPEFIELLIAELDINPALRSYYRLLEKPSRRYWRQAYLEQRLQFIDNTLGRQPKNLLDVGCGYGTTAIFACLNGHRVKGTTLEFYFEQLRPRLEYWSQFGDLSKLEIAYENLFDNHGQPAGYDHIIVQDTLHHLEPIADACRILYDRVKPGGSLIVVEENGNHPYIRAKNFAIRGFNRVGEIYDERLGKMIPFGNENARSFRAWKGILTLAGFTVHDAELVRILPPFCYSAGTYRKRMALEQQYGKHPGPIKNYLFFGFNCEAIKSLKT